MDHQKSIHAIALPPPYVSFILERSQILTLINGDRIPLTNSMSLLFEVSQRYFSWGPSVAFVVARESKLTFL